MTGINLQSQEEVTLQAEELVANLLVEDEEELKTALTNAFCKRAGVATSSILEDGRCEQHLEQEELHPVRLGDHCEEDFTEDEGNKNFENNDEDISDADGEQGVHPEGHSEQRRLIEDDVLSKFLLSKFESAWEKSSREPQAGSCTDERVIENEVNKEEDLYNLTPSAAHYSFSPTRRSLDNLERSMLQSMNEIERDEAGEAMRIDADGDDASGLAGRRYNNKSQRAFCKNNINSMKSSGSRTRDRQSDHQHQPTGPPPSRIARARLAELEEESSESDSQDEDAGQSGIGRVTSDMEEKKKVLMESMDGIRKIGEQYKEIQGEMSSLKDSLYGPNGFGSIASTFADLQNLKKQIQGERAVLANSDGSENNSILSDVEQGGDASNFQSVQSNTDLMSLFLESDKKTGNAEKWIRDSLARKKTELPASSERAATSSADMKRSVGTADAKVENFLKKLEILQQAKRQQEQKGKELLAKNSANEHADESSRSRLPGQNSSCDTLISAKSGNNEETSGDPRFLNGLDKRALLKVMDEELEGLKKKERQLKQARAALAQRISLEDRRTGNLSAKPPDVVECIVGAFLIFAIFFLSSKVFRDSVKQAVLSFLQ